jgi:hypothetical protein
MTASCFGGFSLTLLALLELGLRLLATHLFAAATIKCSHFWITFVEMNGG